MAVLFVACGGGIDETSSTSPGGSGFCAQNRFRTFCDDFDGKPFSSIWDSVTATNGTVGLDSSTSTSLPNSFDSTAAPTTGATGEGRLTKEFGSASHVTVGFNIHVDSAPDRPNGDSETSILVVGVGPMHVLGLNANAEQLEFFESESVNGAPVTISSGTLVPTADFLGRWVHIVFDADLKNRTLTVTIGGVTELSGAMISPPPGVSTNVSVGYFVAEGPAPARARYDDVTIDATS